MLRFCKAVFAAALLIGLGLPSNAFGQTTSATVSGTVTDATAATIANATVTIKNTSTGIETVATTNSRGFYTFPNLSIGGPYTVDIDAPGFKEV